jgi:hypothetical protein
MMIIWGLMFFTCLIAFNNGEIRGIYFVDCCIGFVLYNFTVHKPFYKYFYKIARRNNKFVKNHFKKLRFNEKSFKNLLHFGK